MATARPRPTDWVPKIVTVITRHPTTVQSQVELWLQFAAVPVGDAIKIAHSFPNSSPGLPLRRVRPWTHVLRSRDIRRHGGFRAREHPSDRVDQRRNRKVLPVPIGPKESHFLAGSDRR